MSEIKKGTTGRTEYFRLVTSSGTPLLGANVASMTMSYVRDRATPISSIMSALSSMGAAHAGFRGFEPFSGYSIGSNWAPGLYRADVPDSAYVSGADKVIVALTHPLADPAMKEFELVDNIVADAITALTSLDTRASSIAVQVGSNATGISSIYARIGLDVGSVQVGVNSLLANVASNGVAVGSLGITLASLHTRTSSVATAIASVQTGVNSIYARIGDAGINLTSVSVAVGGINSVQTGINSLLADASSVYAIVNSTYDRIGPFGINLTSIVAAGAGTIVTDITSAALARFFNRDSGLYYSSAVSGSIVAEITKNAGGSGLTLTDIASAVAGAATAGHAAGTIAGTIGTNLDYRVSSLATAVGSVAAAVSGVSTAVGSNSTALASLHTRVASVAVQVSSIWFSTNPLPSDPAGHSIIVAATDAILAAIANVGSDGLAISSVQVGVNSIYARIGLDVGSVQTGVNSALVALASANTAISSVYGGVLTANTGVGSVQVGVNSLYANIGTAAANVASIQTGVNSILAKTNSLTFGAGTRLSVDVTAVNSDAMAGASLAKTTRAIGRGTVNSGTSQGVFATGAHTPSGSVADQFKGRIVTFDADTLTAALRGQSTDIVSNSSAAAPVFGVSSLTTAPASGDTFSVT